MNFDTKTLKGGTIEVRGTYSHTRDIMFLLTSDHHFDSVHCDRDLLKRHHDEAVERGAAIIAIGDIFDAMQGRNDRRGSKGAIRPEYLGGNYYDLVTEDAAKFYSRYAPNYLMMSYGNHETAITRHVETDVLRRLTYHMHQSGAKMLHLGRYSGWIVFRFEHESGGNIRTFRLYYHHGYGGGGPVTKGVIQTNRRAVYLPDADMVLTGHIHERWNVPITRNRIKANGEEYLDTQHHIQISTYKEEYLAHEEFHTERGGAPKPLGGAWLTLRASSNKKIIPEITWAN